MENKEIKPIHYFFFYSFVIMFTIPAITITTDIMKIIFNLK